MDKRKEYVNLRLKLARDKMRVAKLLLSNGEYRDVVSKAYYSIFYATKAFLLAHGQDPHTHKGVDIIFRKFCATHRKPPENLAKMLSVMRQARLSADYSEKALLSKEDAQEAVGMAGSFLKEIQRLIRLPK